MKTQKIKFYLSNSAKNNDETSAKPRVQFGSGLIAPRMLKHVRSQPKVQFGSGLIAPRMLKHVSASR
ncbi:hypothetical protein [Nisaea sp.]|uniref:hypothetical protein n=1 Tax=Nisaea sp. TaxID=2024842 RepID=UPI003B517F1B